MKSAYKPPQKDASPTTTVCDFEKWSISHIPYMNIRLFSYGGNVIKHGDETMGNRNYYNIKLL